MKELIKNTNIVLEDGKPNKEENEGNDDKIIKKVRSDISNIFDNSKAGENRRETLLSKVGPILVPEILGSKLSEEERKNILEELKKCGDIENREEFIEKVLIILNPLIELRRKDPGTFEKIRREAFIKGGGFIPVNEIFSYGLENDFIHIHLAPAETMGLAEKLSAIKNGLEELAKIVNDNKSIKEIVATSWIVAENPKILERLGFEIEGEIDEETKRKYFANEERAVAKASISREKFLESYLNK